ncbi:MATE family efflux transporter [Luteolibacter algae]|uniref:Multidrug-efflux transporter n=1 Tax=Luteolibacter algae TaxID=454151 RepID=A0ABW5D8B2_9BACT
MSALAESRITLKLAFPLIIGQVSQMLLGVADTMMIGKLGVTELAVLTFANSLFYVPFVFGIGVLTSISVFTSNAHGSKNQAAGRASCRHGMYVGTILGLILFAVMSVVSWNLGIFGQPEAVQERTGLFFRIIMASMVPALMSIVLKNHADALDRPWPPFWIFLWGVVLNVFLNWVMIYGKLGCPRLGLEGAAWATLISRFAILIAMFIWLYKAKGMREWVPYHWFKTPVMSDIKRFLAIGVPASIQMIAEVSAFSGAGLMMGKFGETAMAAHQVALMCAATAFMIPLGLSMALSVRVGSAVGAGEMLRLRPIAISGWVIGAGYSLCAAVFFLFFGAWLASLYTDVSPVIDLAARIMIVVGVFQLVDSLQVCSVSMLRGLQDARIPAMIDFVAYWILGIPMGIWLSVHMGYGAIGVWCGLAIGLFFACIMLVPRLWKMTGRLAATGNPV